jgi:hypothetical protein
MEVRADDEGSGIGTLEGHAAVFNKKTNIADMFDEVILPGAFTKTLREGDPRMLWNHDPGKPLARQSTGSLQLDEDKKGLHVVADLPDTTYGRDAKVSVGRGDVSQMSFGFSVVKEEWDEDKNLRSIVEVRLFEVSPVAFAAYETTDVEARAVVEAHKADTTSEPGLDAHSEAGADERVADALFIKREQLKAIERKVKWIS